jgi:hypothetical protein
MRSKKICFGLLLFLVLGNLAFGVGSIDPVILNKIYGEYKVAFPSGDPFPNSTIKIDKNSFRYYYDGTVLISGVYEPYEAGEYDGQYHIILRGEFTVPRLKFNSPRNYVDIWIPSDTPYTGSSKSKKERSLKKSVSLRFLKPETIYFVDKE